MKAIVIGCNGYLGKHLCAFLLKQKWTLQGYDRDIVASISALDYSVLDITQKKQVDKIDTSSFDFIFYFAGLTGTSKAYEDYEQYIDTNEKGLINLLNKMRNDKSFARLVFPSTRLIYKGKKNIALKEEDEKEFKTIYALNKWFGEQVIQQYHKYFDIDFNIFRICVPYGNLFPNSYSYGTIGFFFKKAKAKENIVLFGDGEQKRTFTHVEDICIQIYTALIKEATKNQIYNVQGETFSLREIAKKIAKKTQVKVEYKEWPIIDEKLESGDTIFNSGKIQEITHHSLKNTFESWLEGE